EMLEKTAETVNSLLGNRSNDGFKPNDAEDWTPFDIVGHLIHGEETDWIPRAEIILAQGENRTFEAFDRFAQFEASKGKSLSELLQTFADERQKSLETLKSWNLTENQLQLKGMHPELGEVNLEQ